LSVVSVDHTKSAEDEEASDDDNQSMKQDDIEQCPTDTLTTQLGYFQSNDGNVLKINYLKEQFQEHATNWASFTKVIMEGNKQQEEINKVLSEG